MINIQLKHAQYSNEIVNNDCSRLLHIVADDINVNRPDRFWIMTNADQHLFTYGTKNEHDSAAIPTQLNGLDVVPQIRTGGITYHGPGQLSWVGIMNYRRLRRIARTEVLSIDAVLSYFRDAVNAEFNENLESHPADPGLYRPTGEKIASYGIDLPGVSWLALKLSLNLHVNLDVYDNTTICGVDNRPMGNLLQSLPDLATQQQLATNITQRFLDLVYEEYQTTPWTDEP
jgi:lipoate-protein ligase B